MSLSSSYLRSEQFIWDGLKKKAEAVARSLYEIWRQFGKIEPAFYTWPAKRIETEDGEPHEGVCVMELTMPTEHWAKIMRLMISRTQAYALLLIEQQEKTVRVILESQHGAICWTLPIEKHGDIQVLGKIVVRENVENVGLLWRPGTARS